MTGGLCLVDKPGGWTSHDVVARVRKLAATRRVGHAGTLDPMATGVLVIGIDRATKLLGYLTLADKAYTATVRLGQSTTTDDAEGEVIAGGSAAHISESDVRRELSLLTGHIEQVPSAVSAIKVAGRRSYARVRAGESVALKPRLVSIKRLELRDMWRPAAELADIEIAVECSSGTYVRAIARDIGATLGTGGHLVALRRTRVGPFSITDCLTLDSLADLVSPVMITLDKAVAMSFARRDLDENQARIVSHGGRLSPIGLPGVYGVFDPRGRVLGLYDEQEGRAAPVVVFRAQ